jgi:hypothetical protein
VGGAANGTGGAAHSAGRAPPGSLRRAAQPLAVKLASAKISGRMCFTFATLILLIRPLMLLRSASHVARWYCALLLSCSSAMSCASLKGGM